MPTNLNALIRYKTINSCLFGGRRRWSIQELIEACTEALVDARGRYEPVSERTIREDIHIMRSDILGFNAPIDQKKGLYYYSDSKYSILSLRITDAGLADRIYSFLVKLRTQINHPEIEVILKQLCILTKREYEVFQASTIDDVDEDRILFQTAIYEIEDEKKYLKEAELTWKSILSLIFNSH